MEEKKLEKRKNIEIIALSIIIVALLGGLIYLLFIKKDETNEVMKPQDSQQVINDIRFTKVERVRLSTANKVININGKNLNLKVIDNYLYIDDNNTNIETNTSDEYDEKTYTSVPYVDVSDYLIFVYNSAQAFDTLYAIIDENGNKVTYDNYMYEYYDNKTPIPVKEVFVENGKLMGQEYTYALEDSSYPGNIYEMEYDGNKIVFNLTNGEVKLNESNRKIRVNGKELKLKVVDATLYINDVKQDAVHFEEDIFVADKYILVEQHGQCGIAIDYAVDENGKVINVSKNTDISKGDNNNYEVQHIRKENNKVVAELPTGCYCYANYDGECSVKYSEVEFVYDGKNIEIKKVK